MADVPSLAPDYYLGNFLSLLGGLDRYRDLLSDSELGFLARFDQLGHDARCLLVRLLLRKGQWFRISKLHYPELDDLPSALNELRLAGFIETGLAAPHSELNSLLTLAEWRTALVSEDPKAAPLGVSKGATKTQLAALIEQKGLWSSLAEYWRSDCLWLRDDPMALFKLLYFGNSYQDLSEFVLGDMGLRRYENYAVDKALRRFDTRADIDAALLLSQLSEQLELSGRILERDELELMLARCPHPLATGGGLEDKRQQLRGRIARELERRGDDDLALTIYGELAQTPARERSARCLEKLARFEEALAVVEAMIANPWDEQELAAARRMGPRLARLLGRPWLRAPASTIPGQQLALPPFEGKVEQAAVAWFESRGLRAWHLENAFVCGLFGLALWDIIFMPVKGAFDNPFQSRPRDMYRPGFVAARQVALDERLQRLREGELSILTRHFETKQGLVNDWVNWKLFDGEVLEAVLSHLDGALLTDLLERMLKDPQFYRSGWPDLLVLKQDGLAFVEIKGPGDRLQDSQRRWFDWFKSRQLDASVLHISWLTGD
ncbi:VRR-NUC domain-containing protein [Shewanella cyperi]|uniref:VRR-NUC domain-containing protein n=1 Tax=Shewanella cyperi TaxID=2814292 RepID=UPI001A943B3A|nr:VRR-NUC domain-containing protein [Shewanella cyperi]QSX39270.1 VRR-NUC domain-containing protein [Shewanella cyperi]